MTVVFAAPPAEHSQVPPSRLINCEALGSRIDCDTVYFTEILELVLEDDDEKPPLKHPVRIIERAKYVAEKWDLAAARLRVVGALADDRDGKYAGVPVTTLVNNALREAKAKKRAARAAESGTEAAPARESDIGTERSPAALEAQLRLARMLALAQQPSLMTFGGRGSVFQDVIDQIRGAWDDLVIVDLPPALEPTVALRAVFRQDWCSQGYHRGRLLRTIPLTADGKQEIVVKSWEIRKSRREQNDSVAEDISTEFIGDQKWSLATSKEVSANLNQNVNANLNADASVTIPVKAVPVKVGGGGTVGSTTAVGISGTLRESEEKVKQSTFKAANTLKKSVSSAIETAEEAGSEITITETIVNPNKCSSLMYDFFEVTETYEVTTRLDQLEAVLLLPLTVPGITPEWVLCHECLLRKYLQCETFYAGFDAARRLAVGRNLGQFGGTLDNERTNDAAQAALDAIRTMLDAYHVLSHANLTAVPGGQGGDVVGGLIEDGLNAAEEGLGAVIAGGREMVDAVQDGLDAVSRAVSKAVEGGANVVGGLFGQAQMAATPQFAMQAQTAGGGIGSYIYWEVVKIAAPEIVSACAALDAAYGQISTMQPGPERSDAAYRALEQFFTNIGDVDEAFKKVDIALFALFAASALAVFAGIAVVGALAAVAAAALGAGAAATSGVLVPLALAFLGTTVTLSLTALAGTILAVLGDQAGAVDLMPRDLGLKAAIQGMYGLFGNLGGSISLPVAPQGDSPEAYAAYQQQLAEMKREQREMAEALVEFNRLKCYLTENITYFAQLAVQALPEASLRDMLDGFDIPAHAVEARIVGFAGRKVAFRVRDAEWLAQSGFDFASAAEQLECLGLFTDQRDPSRIVLPTPGVSVEPRLGECEACDPFVRTHRALDIDLKHEELAQAKTESQRRKDRVDAGDLTDPVDREARLTVSVDNDGDGG